MSSVFVVSIPGNENDFIGATPSSVNGVCVDVVLGNWIESFVNMIPRNDSALGESSFGLTLHHCDPRNYHLFFLGCTDSVAGTYFSLPIQNLSPTCVTAQFLGLFHRAGHAPWRPILFGVFETTLLQGQTVPPPFHALDPHVFSIFAPAKWTPERTPRIRFRHGLQNVLQTLFPPLRSLPNHDFVGDPHKWRQLCAPYSWIPGLNLTWAHNLLV